MIKLFKAVVHTTMKAAVQLIGQVKRDNCRAAAFLEFPDC